MSASVALIPIAILHFTQFNVKTEIRKNLILWWVQLCTVHKTQV